MAWEKERALFDAILHEGRINAEEIGRHQNAQRRILFGLLSFVGISIPLVSLIFTSDSLTENEKLLISSFTALTISIMALISLTIYISLYFHIYKLSDYLWSNLYEKGNTLFSETDFSPLEWETYIRKNFRNNAAGWIITAMTAASEAAGICFVWLISFMVWINLTLNSSAATPLNKAICASEVIYFLVLTGLSIWVMRKSGVKSVTSVSSAVEPSPDQSKSEPPDNH